LTPTARAPVSRSGRLARTLLGCVGLAIVSGGCRQGGAPATLRLRFTVSPDHAGPFQSVRLAPDWAGVNRHPARDADWLRVGPAAEALVAAPGRPSEAVGGTVAAGAYSRVFNAVSEAIGRRAGGLEERLEAHIEPTALDLRLPPGGDVTVDIVVAVLPGTPNGTDDRAYEAFVMDARLAAAGPKDVTP
jgi:hypothetical protein